ncbi:MAG: glycosyltransferase family 4 protein [Vicinamibacterales bacterium]
MRIGIDAREVVGQATGVGRYLSELVARWTRDPHAARHHLVLFLPMSLARTAIVGTGGASAEFAVVPGAGGTAWEQWSLARAARRAQLDVFFAPGYTAPLSLAMPVVVAMHDVSFAAHPEWFRWREGARQRMFARRTARRAARVLTLTQFSRREISQHLGVEASGIQVIAPAVDGHPALKPAEDDGLTPSVAGAAFASPDHGGDILFAGSLFTRRHVVDLLTGFERVADARDARLTLVGDDRTWPPQQIDARIRASRHASRIMWFRWVSDADLRRLYRRARVFAFLSEYEGFGLTPLEALATGVPALVADVPVAHEAYGEAAHYVQPDDPAAIGAALQVLLDDTPERRACLDAAPDVVARYSWARAARETLDVLESVGSTRP